MEAFERRAFSFGSTKHMLQCSKRGKFMTKEQRPSVLKRIVRSLEGISREHALRTNRLAQMRERHGK